MPLYLNNLNSGEHILANIDVMLDSAMLLAGQLFADDKDIMDSIKQYGFGRLANMIDYDTSEIGDDE